MCYRKIRFIVLFFIATMLSFCRSAKTISIEDCMKTRPIPYKYDEFETRYTRVLEIYHFQDTIAVFKISLPKNYDDELFRYTDGEFDFGREAVYYSYGCSFIYFSEEGYSPNSNKIGSTYSLDLNAFIHTNTYPPTSVSEGVDINELHWKDVRFEWVRYGYCNVLEEDKAIFDSIVNSIKRIK